MLTYQQLGPVAFTRSASHQMLKISITTIYDKIQSTITVTSPRSQWVKLYWHSSIPLWYLPVCSYWRIHTPLVVLHWTMTWSQLELVAVVRCPHHWTVPSEQLRRSTPADLPVPAGFLLSLAILTSESCRRIHTSHRRPTQYSAVDAGCTPIWK